MADTPKSVAEFAARYAPEGAAPHTLILRLGGCTIEVAANDKALVDELDRYFSDFVGSDHPPDIRVVAIEAPNPDLGLDYTIREREPGKTKLKEEYVDLADGRIVRKITTGLVLGMGAGDSNVNVAAGPCKANTNQVINFVNNRYIEWLLHRGGVLGHAAGVAMGDRGLALAGFSGMGKSTLALHLMAHDLDYVSNDRLLVRRKPDGLHMYGVPKLPRINPGTAVNDPKLRPILTPERIEALEKMPVDELWELEEKYDVFIDEIYGEGRFRLDVPMHALVLLNWSRDGGRTRITRIRPGDRPDLLPAFMKSPGLFYEPMANDPNIEMSQAHYIEELGDVEVYEISGGADFAWATERCLTILRGEKPA